MSELSVRSMISILPLVAGLGSGLTDANDPPLCLVSLDTVHLYCEGSVNCLEVLYCTKLRQLYLSAPKWCILAWLREIGGDSRWEMTGTAVQFFSHNRKIQDRKSTRLNSSHANIS